MSRRDRRAKRVGARLNRTFALTHKTDRQSWPIVRAYVPLEDAWTASGYGSAGIVRRQPNGRLSCAMFTINLSAGGLELGFCFEDKTEVELEETLEKIADEMPPFVEGNAGVAAKYTWGAYALSCENGIDWSDEISEPLAMMPKIGGTKRWWAEQFVQDLVPLGLLQTATHIFELGENPRGKEVAVAVSMVFDVPDSNAVVKTMRNRPEDFTEIQGSSRALTFHWIRERKWVVGERVPHALIGIRKREMFGQVGTLSMAARLIAELNKITDGQIKLVHPHWGDFDELMFLPPGLTLVE